MLFLIEEVVSQADIYLAAIGFIWCIWILCIVVTKLYRAVRVFLLSRLLPSDLTVYGEWAVVTGGSSGIGRSFSHQLAKRGMNVVIISNELEALKSVAKEIKHEYGVECRYICTDFTKGAMVYDREINELKGKDIGILINGAGIFGNSLYFLKESEKCTLAMIDLHIGSVVNMTLKILPLMLAKNKGMIINISSMASISPHPFLTMYSSCKAFSDKFTRALSWEYRNTSHSCVGFQSLVPFFISTRLVTESLAPQIIKSLATDCDRFTTSAVNTIGTTHYTTGYWGHELLWFFFKLFPSDILKNGFFMLRRIKNMWLKNK